MDKIRKHWGIAVGTLIGLAAGYIYWREVGCMSGSCPITSSPLNSSLYGAIMGGLVVSMFKKIKLNYNDY